MPAVNVLIKPASSMCNMHCDYCFYCDEAVNRKQSSYGYMSRETADNVIRKTLEFAEGACAFAFQGGEPTLCGVEFYRYFTEQVKKYNTRNLKVSYALQTNGLILDEEWCQFFAENHFLLGVSVDGIQSVHDKYRHYLNGDTYERILANTRLLDQYHVDYNILTVVHKASAAAVKEIYQNYRENGWKYLQFIACLDPLADERGNQEYSLTPEIYAEFLNTLFDLWYKDLILGREPYIRQFDNYIGILLGIEPESCEQRGMCAVQNVIEADGSVYPCDFYVLDDYYLGNLNKNEYLDIYLRRKSMGFIERSAKPHEECMKCKWGVLCRGGCFRNREKTQSLNYFCEAYKVFFEKNINKMMNAARIISQR
ncbi:MAG: anaerobic sulfatase maturase [Solobacterium sp.]|nr:anaerobic sulfatase maturase [Solobacterium sp.]